MLPEAMLVCSQEEESRLLLSVLEELGTRTERYTDPMEGLIRLWSRRFDAVIVDCEEPGCGAEVVREVREAAQNRSAVTIAIIGPTKSAEEAYALGAHFVLRKPLGAFRTRRLLRACHSLMEEEARRYHRHCCTGPVQVVSGVLEAPARLLNLSLGGAAVQVEDAALLQPTVRLRFRLPGTRLDIVPEGKVVWQSPWGRAGIRFTALTAIDRLRLERWLRERLAREEEAGTAEAAACPVCKAEEPPPLKH